MQTCQQIQHNQLLGKKLKSKNQSIQHRRDMIAIQTVYEAVLEWEKQIPEKQRQDKVTRLVAEEWEKQGGRGITVSKLNLYRYLKNESFSTRYTRYALMLIPAITAAMPVEIARRFGLSDKPTEHEIVASAIKECSEAHQAKLLGAPVQKLKKEVLEAQIALSEMLPKELSAPIVAFLTGFVQQCF